MSLHSIEQFKMMIDRYNTSIARATNVMFMVYFECINTLYM